MRFEFPSIQLGSIARRRRSFKPASRPSATRMLGENAPPPLLLPLPLPPPLLLEDEEVKFTVTVCCADGPPGPEQIKL
jgi:hypothetical protein